MYKVILTKKAEKDLDKLSEKNAKRILQKIDKFSKNLIIDNKTVKKLSFVKDGYRLRAGDIRALFVLDHKRKEIIVYRVGKRDSVYKH